MPSAPTQAVLDAIVEQAEAIPSAIVQAVMTAADEAGYTVVQKSNGTPVVVADSTTVEIVSTPIPGMTMQAVAVGTKGWHTRIIESDKQGNVTKGAWVFVPAGSTTDLLE